VENWEANAVESFSKITIDHTKALRLLKTSANLPATQRTNAAIVVKNELQQLLEGQMTYIKYFARLEDLNIYHEIPDQEEFKKYPTESVISMGIMVFLVLKETSASVEMVEKLEKDLAEANLQIKRIENLLASDFAKKAPPQVVAKEEEKLATYKETTKKIKEQLGR